MNKPIHVDVWCHPPLGFIIILLGGWNFASKVGLANNTNILKNHGNRRKIQIRQLSLLILGGLSLL